MINEIRSVVSSVMLSRRYSASRCCRYKTTKQLDPEQKHLWVTRCGAFTLIELLVVVLIIGILAAIALPQYQKAVWKSKAGQIMSLVRSLATAQEIYYMSNGRYATQFDELDIQLPDSETCTTGDSAECRKIGEWNVFIPNGAYSIEAQFQDSVRITSYLEQKKEGAIARQKSGNLVCIARSANLETGKSLCQTIGTAISEDSQYYRI